MCKNAVCNRFIYTISNGRIEKIDLSKIDGFYIERAYFNNIDNDNLSGFKYCLRGKNYYENASDYMIKSYESEEDAEEGLLRLGVKLQAIQI